MRVTSTFQDRKSRGWHLEASLIKDETRGDRLLLALFLAMWWVSHQATSCMHHGKREPFDHTDWRNKGIFRLKCLWLLDSLRRTRHQADLLHCFPFRKQATGWRFSICLGESIINHEIFKRETPLTQDQTPSAPLLLPHTYTYQRPLLS